MKFVKSKGTLGIQFQEACVWMFHFCFVLWGRLFFSLSMTVH